MAALRLSSIQLPSSSASRSGRFAAVLQAPMPKLGRVDPETSLPKLLIQKMQEIRPTNVNGPEVAGSGDSCAVSKLYAVAEAVADRAEMHANIGEQRADWNKLLLGSINSITLAAATMACLSAIPAVAGLGATALAFKVSATLLYSAATGLLMVVNKIQPSQLAEEQRNAARLFRQLLREIKTTLAAGLPTRADVDQALERVLALDKAYPLPLLPGMLDKFPAEVVPTVWWPARSSKKSVQPKNKQQKVGARNGWSGELEKEMRGVISVLKKKDVAEYVRLSKLVLKVNRVLAFSGPFLTGIAAIGSSLIGSSSSAALMVAVAAGAMATVVNTLEHGGQVGMVFEMYRNCGGSYHLLEETIESTLKDEVDMRENGELFEMKLALQLGRSVTELRNLSSSLSNDRDSSIEFAGKLF